MNSKAFKQNFPRLMFFLSLISLLTVNRQLSAHDIEEKIHQTIDDISDACKKAVEKLGNEVDAIQKYLENYSWKGVVQDQATSGDATLSHLKLNDHRRVVAVKVGEQIHGAVNCSLDAKKASFFSVHRVVIGLKGLGPQTAIYTNVGARGGESTEYFTLMAPNTPGFCQIRFRATDHFLESSALEAWYDDEGREPDASSTIGIIYVIP